MRLPRLAPSWHFKLLSQLPSKWISLNINHIATLNPFPSAKYALRVQKIFLLLLKIYLAASVLLVLSWRLEVELKLQGFSNCSTSLRGSSGSVSFPKIRVQFIFFQSPAINFIGSLLLCTSGNLPCHLVSSSAVLQSAAAIHM